MPASSYKNLSITELAKLSQNNDVRALDELIRRTQKDVFTMFSYLTESRQDVSDLTQEALIRMAHGIKNLKETKCFKSWLNHIITNVFYDYTKHAIKDKTVEHDSDKLLEIKDKIGCEPGEKCFYSEVDKLIRIAVLNLPQKLRIVIVLREFEGLSYEEISNITRSSLGTVKSRISRAREKLKTALIDFI